MDLSAEDSLRLNVLLNQDLQAIRINDSKMIVYGLSDRGEAKIQLNPNCQDEKYIKQVKELISSHVLGSPGGYPVFLRRWTRMGQARDESLESLLKLGEPEAVVAVVHASGLTDDLAYRAWWAMPTASNARCMLKNEAVINGSMGKELAEYLIDYLPFEEEAKDIIQSVSLVLQGDLVNEETRQSLWSRGQRKNAYLVGFLKTTPNNVLLESQVHTEYENIRSSLENVSIQSSAIAKKLLKVLDASGQAFLKTVITVMKKPANQDVVIALLAAVQEYFHLYELEPEHIVDIDAIIKQVDTDIDTAKYPEINDLLNSASDIRQMIKAIMVLSRVGEHIVTPVFSRSDAIGTVMRKNLEPVFEPLHIQIQHIMRG
ncbi:MAG: sulfur reduction protein DsrS [Gammaproteobacteria bacterium]|nr:sulfur reduction protein DsrS [Gammaproteobacteria bacterium]